MTIRFNLTTALLYVRFEVMFKNVKRWNIFSRSLRVRIDSINDEMIWNAMFLPSYPHYTEWLTTAHKSRNNELSIQGRVRQPCLFPATGWSALANTTNALTLMRKSVDVVSARMSSRSDSSRVFTILLLAARSAATASLVHAHTSLTKDRRMQQSSRELCFGFKLKLAAQGA